MLNVIFSSAGSHADRHRVALASLPGHYSVSEGPRADIGYADSLYAARTARDAGVRGLVLGRAHALSAADLDAIGTLADDAGIIAVPATMFLPRLFADRNFAAWEAGPVPVISASGLCGHDAEIDLSGLLFEQVNAVEHLMGSNVRASLIERSRRHYIVSAIAQDGSTAVLAGVANEQARCEFSLDAVCVDRRLEARIDAGPLARAGTITLSTSLGAQNGVPVHQSGPRLLWLALSKALSGDGKPDRMPTLKQSLSALAAVSSLLSERS